MVKKKFLKTIAMAFAILVLIAFVVPATATLAANNPPSIDSLLNFYPKQQYVLAFDLSPGISAADPLAITIPLPYIPLESVEIPVFTSDGSFTINVSAEIDDDFGILYSIDLTELADYNVRKYTLYSLTPSIFLKGDTLVTVACDSSQVSYACYYNYSAPELFNTLDSATNEAVSSVEWLTGTDVQNESAIEDWETFTFTLPVVSQKDAFFVTDVELQIDSSWAPTAPTILQVALPMIDSENESIYYYQNIFEDYWSPSYTFEIPSPDVPPVVIDGTPDVTSWMANLFGNIFSIELFPGITFGGLLICFIAIPVALIFLRLFAGG